MAVNTMTKVFMSKAKALLVTPPSPPPRSISCQMALGREGWGMVMSVFGLTLVPCGRSQNVDMSRPTGLDRDAHLRSLND